MSTVSDSSFDYSTIGKTQAYINAENAASDDDSSILTQEDFLMLLTTQLENQDPTEPMDNTQMVTQLSQISMVESLTTISEQMSDIVSAVNSSSAVTASSLVGLSVLIDSDEGFFDGLSTMYARIDAGTGVTDITIQIKDSSGTVVAEYTADSGYDNMEFAWDGIKEVDEDGNITYFSSGMYTIEATGYQNGVAVSLPVQVYATVGSVTLGSTYSDTILNLIGYGDITMAEVEEISL